jgi:hypothetical protein
MTPTTSAYAGLGWTLFAVLVTALLSVALIALAMSAAGGPARPRRGSRHVRGAHGYRARPRAAAPPRGGPPSGEGRR